MSPPPPDPVDRVPLVTLLSAFLAEARQLFGAELRLASTELRLNAIRLILGLALILAGGLMLGAAGLALLAALIAALAPLIGPLGAALATAAAALLAAALLIAIGIGRLRNAPLAPRRALANLKPKPDSPSQDPEHEPRQNR